MVVWLTRVITVLCQVFCSIKDIRIYVVTEIINNNVDTKITRLQKKMVALENLVSSEDLSFLPLCEFKPLIVTPTPTQLLKSSAFFHPFPLLVRGVLLCYDCIKQT